MKHNKLTLCKEENTVKKKKKKRCLPPTYHKTFYFPCFLLFCNAVIRVKDINVVQFKRKFHYIVSKREFFITSKKKIKFRIKTESLMLRKRKITKF